MSCFSRLLFNILAIGFFGIAGYLLLYGQQADWATTGRAGIAFVSAVACAFIGNLDKFESLKASVSGIEAKTREATKVVQEARVALNEFHVLAEMTGSLLIELMTGAGRMGGSPPEYDAQRRKRILDALTTIGLSTEAIQRVNSSDKYWVSIDYSLGILNRINKSTACSPELKKLATTMLGRWNGEDFRPTPDDFTRMLETAPCTDEEVVNLVEDYRRYIQSGEHRRLAVWQDRKHWLR